MAFIRKRSGKNGVSFHLYDKEGDFQIAKKIPVDNLRDAKEYLRQYLGEKVNGKPSSLMVKEMSFSKLVEKYLEYSRHRKTANGYGKDMYMVTLLLNEFGRFQLMEITKQMIETKQNKWKDQGRANKTINNRTTLLGTILNYALDNGYVPFTPKVKKLKVDKKRPIIFSDEEVTRIFSAATGLLRDYLVVYYHTGCRLSEIRFLKWVEINFDRRELYVEKSKSHTYRVIPINDQLLEHLQALKRRKKRNQIYLFELEEGHPLSDYYHRFKKMIVKMGIEGSIHQFRRTFTSKLVDMQVPIEVAQELLGHSSIEVTKSHYTRIAESRLRQAVNLLRI